MKTDMADAAVTEAAIYTAKASFQAIVDEATAKSAASYQQLAALDAQIIALHAQRDVLAAQLTEAEGADARAARLVIRAIDNANIVRAGRF